MRLSTDGGVDTERASRLLTELCEHLTKKAEARPDLRVRVERHGDRGAVDFGWAGCELRADRRRLTVHVEANDHECLEALRGYLTWHLAELGARVSWTGAGLSEDPRAGMRSFHRRMRR